MLSLSRNYFERGITSVNRVIPGTISAVFLSSINQARVNIAF